LIFFFSRGVCLRLMRVRRRRAAGQRRQQRAAPLATLLRVSLSFRPHRRHHRGCAMLSPSDAVAAFAADAQPVFIRPPHVFTFPPPVHTASSADVFTSTRRRAHAICRERHQPPFTRRAASRLCCHTDHGGRCCYAATPTAFVMRRAKRPIYTNDASHHR